MANELKSAASPYLLQHADNPVHWRQWTPDALALAQREDKPILLSVGYAACHWCHVMAHESFEDPATAAVMNSLFVNIKVDREERPDVDHIYMSALHAFGERGGWPLTMFLTPKCEPFWGGTYFPKVARYGQPAFTDVLQSVARAYREDTGRVAQNTRAVLDHLARAAPDAAETLTLAELDRVAAQLAPHMDATHGGMTGAPKFPNPSILEFLWRAAGRTGREPLRALVLLTLERMSQGGIFDHLGGGFARYSTDERWLAPHFEKMLYDNAQLLELLALAACASGDPLYRQRAEETVEWLRREMTAPGGAFCASLDADSEGVEGKFYVWTAAEVADTLAPDDAALFARAFDVTPEGNWAEEPHGPRVSILNRLTTPLLSREEEARLPALRRALLDHRARRVRPGLDDKILADWNGLAIAALVRAGTALDHPDWIADAARAYAAIVTTMVDADGRLAHSRRGDALVRPALALDYAATLRAALALHEARGLLRGEAPDYLGDAVRFARALLRFHRDADTGRLCMAAHDAGDVILRLSPTGDDAIPNAHAVALDGLVRLAALSGDAQWLEAADQLFAAVSGAARAAPIGHLGILNALDTRLRGATVVTAGPERAALTRTALAAPYLLRSVVDLSGAEALPSDHPAAAQLAAAGAGAAFVCVAGTCSLPLHDGAALAERLAQL